MCSVHALPSLDTCNRSSSSALTSAFHHYGAWTSVASRSSDTLICRETPWTPAGERRGLLDWSGRCSSRRAASGVDEIAEQREAAVDVPLQRGAMGPRQVQGCVKFGHPLERVPSVPSSSRSGEIVGTDELEVAELR